MSTLLCLNRNLQHMLKKDELIMFMLLSAYCLIQHLLCFLNVFSNQLLTTLSSENKQNHFVSLQFVPLI